MTEEVWGQVGLLSLGCWVFYWDSNGFLLRILIWGAPLLAWGETMIIKAWCKLTLLLCFLGVGWLWPCSSSLWPLNHNWNYIVNINLLLTEGSILRIVCLFKSIWWQHILFHFIGINICVFCVDWFRVSSGSIPSCIGSTCNSCSSLRVGSLSWIFHIFILVGQNTWLKFLALSLISGFLWHLVTAYNSRLCFIFWHKIRFSDRVTLTIELSSFSLFSCSIVKNWSSSLRFLAHHCCKWFFFLPFFFFISPKTFLSGSFLGQTFSSWNSFGWTGENCALPLGIFPLDSWSRSSFLFLILSSHHIGFIRIVVPQLLRLGWWVGSWLNGCLVRFIAKDIWVLVRLSCSPWLNFISSKLSISGFVVGESSFLWSLESIEGDVALEGTGYSQVFAVISGLVLIGKDVRSNTCIEFRSRVRHFQIKLKYLFIN